jgi:AcrR family transcriptional regulator
MLNKKSNKTPQNERLKAGWQAKKSAMTRQAILEAAIQCIVDHGYAQTTTSLIADRANVSRGAMTHHFPSRSDVLTATIEYLHERRLREYRALMQEFDISSKLTAREQIETVVDMAWKFATLSSSIAYQEILMASRTDPELRRALEPLEKEFEEALLELVKRLFPRWGGREEIETAHDVATFLLIGMNLSHMRSRKKLRSKRVLAYLADSVEGLYRRARREYLQPTG